MSWIKDNGTWHEMTSSRIKENVFLAKTTCGLELVWDQATIDRLPGGGEVTCDSCLTPQVEAVATPKKKGKKA